MKAYIVNATYRILDGKPIVHLFGRMENGESFLAKVPFVPYFAIKKKDLNKALEIRELDHVETNLKTFAGEPVVRMNTVTPSDVKPTRELFVDNDIITYESDIRFVQRFYMDHDILGTIDIDGAYSKGDNVTRVYDDAKIKAVTQYDVKLKVLSFDIETDKDIKNIYSCSIVCEDVKEVHIVTEKKVKDAILYNSERELLQGILERINQLDPDVMTGWNVVDFDFSVIRKRLQYYKIPFAIGRDSSTVNIRVRQDFFRDSSATVAGRIVFDGISLMKQSFLKFQDYKLNTVAEAVLGKKKVELEPDFWEKFPEIVKNQPEKVVKYNLVDSQLVLDILNEKKLIELMIKKSLITGLQLDRVKGSVAALDSLYIREARKRGYVCPNSSFGERTERIKGAHVMKPKPGIYDYVAVFDFKSLYPSIIRTYNIDPIAHDKKGTIVAPNKARFVDDDGILPMIIQSLWKERDNAKKEKDDVKSYAIKIIMNSFYGVLANPSCRFYSLDMGNAITSFAREAIKETASIIEDSGFDVLYGDTDSVFVDLKIDNVSQAEKVGGKISRMINEHFKLDIKKKFNRRSFLELEFEKMFKVLMLPRMRKGDAGAKKRYAGLLLKNGKEEIKVTGMEIVRRDWTELAKKMQWELLDRVFHKKEVAAYIKKIVEDMKKGKYDEQLVYRKSIRKDLAAYTKTTPPHVKAARMLPKLTSSIIEYYITTNGPEPVSIRKSSIDYEHYIEKQIKPIADTILDLFGQSFEEVIDNSKQKNLFDY